MAQLKDPQALFGYKLGTALGLERKALATLGKLEQTATMDDVKQQLAEHAQQTEGQIRNLEQAMKATGDGMSAHEDKVMDAIAQHGEEMIGRVDDMLVDTVILGGVAETEHHEICMYESLITMASTMGEDDIVALLQENLEQEQQTLKKAESTLQQLAQRAGQTTRA